MFTSQWDVMAISLVLALRFLGPFAFGVSLAAWMVLRPSRGGRSGLRKAVGIVLGALICSAPVFLFLDFG